MAKSKVKRYADEGAVYEDDTPEEVANRSSTSQDIANEDKGDTMLKAMRDEAAKPKAVAKPKAKSFAQKAKDANFTSAETGGGAALMTRKPTAKAGSGSTTLSSIGDRLRSAFSSGKKSSGNSVDFGGTGLGMAKGGSASSRADGIASRGKTRGKMY